jgi:hypothetical protein
VSHEKGFPRGSATMGIGPIPDLRPLTAIEPEASVSELRAVGRIENSSRSGNPTSGRRQTAARQDENFEEPAAESEEETAAPGAEEASASKISFFA